MAIPQNPERYTAREWLEDFAEYARLAPAQTSGRKTGEWMNLHFATKYPTEDEAYYRQSRFETAVLWLVANKDAVMKAIGAPPDSERFLVTPSVFRMLYIVYGLNYGQWPMPQMPPDGMIQLLRKQIESEKNKPHLL